MVKLQCYHSGCDWSVHNGVTPEYSSNWGKESNSVFQFPSAIYEWNCLCGSFYGPILITLSLIDYSHGETLPILLYNHHLWFCFSLVKPPYYIWSSLGNNLRTKGLESLLDIIKSVPFHLSNNTNLITWNHFWSTVNTAKNFSHEILAWK